MEHYIYIYLNPLKIGKYQYKKFNFEYEPFYVGLGKKNRINHHILEAVHKNKYNLQKTIKDNIILKILKNNLEPIRFKLYENLTLESAIRIEKCLIKIIGRRNLGLGTLANLTDGGEGIINKVYTEQEKKVRKELTKNLWLSGVFDDRNISGEKNGFYNKKHSNETKEKIKKTIGENRKGEKNANYGNNWTDKEKEDASIRQIENHKHLIGDNNPSKRSDVRIKISESKMGLKNPNAKKWLLISPNNEEFVIDGGIKRNLKIYNLDYQQFKNKNKINKNGWLLKEI